MVIVHKNMIIFGLDNIFLKGVVYERIWRKSCKFLGTDRKVAGIANPCYREGSLIEF